MALPPLFLQKLSPVFLLFIISTVVHAFESEKPSGHLSHGLPFNVSISGFSGTNITSLIPIYYRHLIPSIAKQQLTSSYAIHHCPDDLRFISSRCVRKHGPQAWSASCKDDRSPPTWSIYYGMCDSLQICTDLPKSKVQGATALCLDQFDMRTSRENDIRDMKVLENIGGQIEGAMQLEISVTSQDARSMLPVESIHVWEEVIYTPGGGLSRHGSPSGEGHCSNCSSLMVTRIGQHSRRVNVKVQLPQENQDARVFLVSTSISEAR